MSYLFYLISNNNITCISHIQLKFLFECWNSGAFNGYNSQLVQSYYKLYVYTKKLMNLIKCVQFITDYTPFLLSRHLLVNFNYISVNLKHISVKFNYISVVNIYAQSSCLLNVFIWEKIDCIRINFHLVFESITCMLLFWGEI